MVGDSPRALGGAFFLRGRMWGMNCRYFACPNCRVYIDAGYRWAYWTLEHPGIVIISGGVDVEAVRGCAEYWAPPVESRSPWLVDRILPRVRVFIEQHGSHGMVYVDEEVIYNEDTLYYNWKEIET